LNNIPQWLRRLNDSRTGLWSILYPTGSSFRADLLTDNPPPGIETAVLKVFTAMGSPELHYGDQVAVGPDMRPLLESCGQNIAEAGCHSIRVLVESFHKAPAAMQCKIIRSSRAIQETSTQVSWQFVFCGQWSYYAFRDAYYQIYGHTNSPPAHSKDIVQVPSLAAKDVIALLAEHRVIGVYPSEIDGIAAEFLVEQTGGDEFLIGEAIQYLEQLGSDWTEHIEQVLDELTRSTAVVDEVTLRLHSLDEKARAELDKLLRVQRLIRNMDSVEAEQLWLAGLACRRQLGSGKQCVHLASPLTNIVLRRNLHGQKSKSVALSEDLCFERAAIAAAAYRKISQIEIMLRNLVVECWHSEDGEMWQDRLNKITIPSHDLGKDDDRRQFLDLLIEYGVLPQKTPGEEAETSQPRPDRPKETLLTSATHWQHRQSNNHAVELSNSNLMQFLMTGSLMSVLVDRKLGLCGQGKPFKKEYLVTALEEYIAIRSAVAHNQAFKLNTISHLDDLHRKLVDWLTVYADQA